MCAGRNHVCDGQGSVCAGNTEDIYCPGTFLCSDNKWQVGVVTMVTCVLCSYHNEGFCYPGYSCSNFCLFSFSSYIFDNL